MEDWDFHYDEGITGAMGELGQYTELSKFLGPEAYDWVQYEPSGEYTILVYKLLSFFFDYLRREVVGLGVTGVATWPMKSKT